MEKLKVIDSVSYGLSQVIQNLKYFAVLMGSLYASSFGLIFAIVAVAGLLFLLLGPILPLPALIVLLAVPGIALGTLILVALYYGLLKNLIVYHDEACGCAPLSLLYYFFNSFIFSLIGCVILYWLAMLGGFMLLILPGIFLWVRLMFTSFFMVDKKMKVLQAFKKSYALTQGSFWRLFLLNIIAGFIFNLSGGFMQFVTTQYYFIPVISGHILPTIFGLVITFLVAIITIPASQLMLIHAFRQLQKIKGE